MASSAEASAFPVGGPARRPRGTPAVIGHQFTSVRTRFVSVFFVCAFVCTLLRVCWVFSSKARAMAPLLYFEPASQPCRAVLTYAQCAGIPLEIKLTSVVKGETHSPEYLAINPLGKVPFLTVRANRRARARSAGVDGSAGSSRDRGRVYDDTTISSPG